MAAPTLLSGPPWYTEEALRHLPVSLGEEIRPLAAIARAEAERHT